MTEQHPELPVPFLNLQDTYIELKDRVDAAVTRVLSSGFYINGPEVEAFEREWAEYCGASFAVGTSNGLDALVIALKTLGIGVGDEVIVPSHTYIATWLAVSEVGAKIVPVEPNPDTFNIDELRIQKAVTARTKAIIAVHLYGRPAAVSTIADIAKRNQIYLIEDAAQAHGAQIDGKRIGSHGDMVCWSFYPGKNLGAFGDAGAITTNSEELADSARVYLNYGSSKRYEHVTIGSNKRLDPIQAAILREKLRVLDSWNERRIQIASLYQEHIKNKEILLPPSCHNLVSVWHLFVIRTKKRQALLQYLQDCKINCLIHYPTPPFMQVAYAKHSFDSYELEIARSLSQEILSLPMGPHLTTSQALYICDCINDFGKQNAPRVN